MNSGVCMRNETHSRVEQVVYVTTNAAKGVGMGGGLVSCPDYFSPGAKNAVWGRD